MNAHLYRSFDPRSPHPIAPQLARGVPYSVSPSAPAPSSTSDVAPTPTHATPNAAPGIPFSALVARAEAAMRWPTELARLQGMGFEAGAAAEALLTANGSLGVAADQLTRSGTG